LVELSVRFREVLLQAQTSTGHALDLFQGVRAGIPASTYNDAGFMSSIVQTQAVVEEKGTFYFCFCIGWIRARRARGYSSHERIV
jgi:hypothetical protein